MFDHDKDFLTPREFTGPPTCGLTTALVVGGTMAATAAAQAGAQAASGGKGGSGGGGAAPGSEAPLWERLVNRDVLDIANQERTLIESAVREGRMLAPELYRALGLEPQFAEDPQAVASIAARENVTRMEEQLGGLDERMKQLQDEKAAARRPRERQAAQKALRAAEAERKSLVASLAGARASARSLGGLSEQTAELEAQLSQLETEQAALKAKKGPGGQRRQYRIETIDRQRQEVLRKLQVARRDEGAAAASPYKIVGFKKLNGEDIPADSPLSMQNPNNQILRAQQQRLLAALRGENPTDPTLLKALDEKERKLHAQLQQQLGPDYAVSTIGSDALRNFEREKAEAVAQYNREIIGEAAQQNIEQGTHVENLLASFLNRTSYVPSWSADMARQLEGPASVMMSVAENARRNRQTQMQGNQGGGRDEGNPMLAAALSGLANGARGFGLSYLGSGMSTTPLGRDDIAHATSQGVSRVAASSNGQIPITEDM